MCGIAGLFRAGGGIGPEDVRAVERATAAQRHRGPDDSGIYEDSRAVLGFRRLSIIDLSPAGHQPMSNEDGSVWVVYNGEIYNYRELRPELLARGHVFRSQADTEILLHGYEEWGIEGLLERLRGMYALALYDSRKARCILARDRFGIKPLYYYRAGEKVAFASEVKALVRSGLAPDEPNREGIIGFMLFGAVPSPLTSVRGVECLPPGHYLVAGREGISVHQYWDMHAEAAGSGAESEADLAAVLQDAVSRHLISDVPVGMFLSGGVDSAGLVALAKQAFYKERGARLSTLTVFFDEKEFSEAPMARRVAERFGTDHREVRVTGEDFMAELPKLLAAMDQPTNDGVNTYFVSRAARQAGLTVVLSGLGGDEMFWGYKHYRWLATYRDPLRWLPMAPAILRNPLLEGVVAYGRFRGRENLMRLGFLKNRLNSEALYLAVRGFFAPEQITGLLDITSSELRSFSDKYCGSQTGTSQKNGSAAGAFSYLEAQRYMHDQLLRDTDVFSMAHSIEVRVPYLDHCVTDLSMRLNPERKRPGLMNKPALVRAVGDDLVSELSRQRKLGFTFPLASWMHKNAARLQEIAGQARLLNPAAVGKVWNAFGAGRLHWSRAWATVVLGMKP